ncbi:TOLL-like receptor [Chamberlinius hualienensis]
MDMKIFVSFICASFVLQIQTQSSNLIDRISVDNCIFNCGGPRWNYRILPCKVDCNGPTSFSDKNHSINDVLKASDHFKYPTNMNWLSILSNDIFGFNINYFCSIKYYRIEKLKLENSKLNDSSKLGLGDINNCEDDNSKCELDTYKLELYNSPLQVLKNHSFCHLKNLSILTLTNCSLNSIEADAFKFNNELKYLNLDQNRLTEIPHLEHLSSLKTLYASNNFITSIKNEDLINFDDLEILYLNGNQINSIEDNAFDQLIYGVIRGIKSFVRAKRAKKVQCAYRLMQNAGTPIETDGKVFDVFISYSNEDSDFVATKIVPKLENIKDPYHVCVHERNFLGGGSIEDTIIEAIKKSTRIIVILTENYMKSDWCMYEFVIAHSVMIEDQCPRVVLIIKDELPIDINPNLQIYLSTNTYIEWTDQKFWQRLHFALSSNKLPMEQTLQPMNFLMSTRVIGPDD